MKKANTIAAVIGILISVYALAVTFTFKQFKNVPVGPEFFPRYLSIGLLICSCVLLGQSIFSTSTEEAPTLSLKDSGMQRLLIAVVGLIVFTALWELVGFIILTPVFLFGLMYLLQMRKYRFMALMSVSLGVGIFFLFKILLGIEMPLGILAGLF